MTILEQAIENNRKWTKEGQIASYIPELAKNDSDALGVSIYQLDGGVLNAGDYNTKFTIQSVSKVIILACALMDHGKEAVFKKVGMEPSADPFNSIAKLETRKANIPLNPFINAGAIVCTSLVSGDNGIEKFDRIMDLMKRLSDNPDIQFNNNVYRSEKLTGNTNRAIAYYLKGADIIQRGVEDVLDAYFKACSVEMVVEDVAKIASVFANDGVAPWSGEQMMPKSVTRIVRAIMTTCGLYDTSGSFAVEVGTPAKSGVGGCIMAVVPGRMGMAVIGPSLDEHGNSIAGQKVLEELSVKMDLHIF